MQKGEIILISFPFTDLSGIKKRPALILAHTENNIVVAFISTQKKWAEDTDLLVEPTPNNGLKRASLIRIAKIATIDKSLALGLLGKLEPNTLHLVDQQLIRFFRLQ